jgi:hypothetical protein
VSAACCDPAAGNSKPPADWVLGVIHVGAYGIDAAAHLCCSESLREGLTNESKAAARAYPSHVPVHGPGVRLAGAQATERCC